MDAKEIIQGLMSTDRDNVVRASWKIIHSNDPHVLQVVSDQLPAISKSVKTLSPNSEPALRDYRFAPELTVEILKCFNQTDVFDAAFILHQTAWTLRRKNTSVL